MLNASRPGRPELVCPAGTPASLRAAVDAGADAVYCGFQNASNARNFSGLNFTRDQMAEGIAYAHERGSKVLVTVNTFPRAGDFGIWQQAIDDVAQFRADAAIIADIGVADYAARNYPDLRLHLSVQAGASSAEAIRFYCESFGVKRVVLPRILTVPEIEALKSQISSEIECFIFGNHGLMAEGRCSLTNYVTGLSTNMDGVCSPADRVRFEEDGKGGMAARLGDFQIDCFNCDENPGYPTICKGRYVSEPHAEGYYAFEEPISLNLARKLPELIGAGVDAFKIEGRQRSKAYVKKVVAAWRGAIDAVLAGKEVALDQLLGLTEGHKQTEGAYAGKRWR